MATTTLYPASYTYVSNKSASADHSGASQLQSWNFFKTVWDNLSDANWQQATSQGTTFPAAIIRFTRSSVLKYARITSVVLTWTLKGSYMGENKADAQAWIAPYSTESSLSAINWLNVRTAGVKGDWSQIGSAGYVSTPSVRTANITSYFTGDQSSDSLDIILAAGSGYDPSNSIDTYIDPSGCYLTVTYEPGAQPAPTPIYPKDQTIIEAESTLFSWQFNSDTSALQTAVQLEYKNVEDVSYTVLNLTQSAYSYTLNAALPAGSYQWRLQATNDAGITSGYSEIAYFNIVGKPAVPIINEPENKALTEITWNTVSQQSFEIILADQSGRELIHETQATASASYKPNIFLKGQYLVKIRVLNDSMMWSDWAQKGFTISAAGPAAATMSVLSAAGIPAVRIGYTLPADTDAALMRKHGEETKILAVLDPNVSEYVDDTVSAGTVYQYFIRTYVNGYTDSTAQSASADFEGAVFQIDGEYLNLRASDEQFLPHSEEISAPYALNEFSGRSYYVIERGESINVNISRRFYVEKEQKKILDRMSLMESVYYRDNKDNAFRAAILRTSYDAHMGDGYLATINIVRLNEEEVEVNV